MKHATLRDLTGHTLTGLYIDGARLHLRMLDQVVSIDLKTGSLDLKHRKVKGSQVSLWVVLPGWLRITKATRAVDRVCLDVSGALYSSQIILGRQKNPHHVY